MKESASHIAELLLKQLHQELSSEETDTLLKWRRASSANEQKFRELRSFNALQTKRQAYVEAKRRAAQNVLGPVHRVHILKTAWFRYAAAIIVLISVGSGVYLLKSSNRNPVVSHIKSVLNEKSDVVAGSDRAILTLSNGEHVELNTSGAQTIKDGEVRINNANGGLVYKNTDIVAMNTMTTPKGGQYQLTLADGTKVWLNAASSITFPTSFKGLSREVSVTGEAYFEVVANKRKPFVVKTVSGAITVLGTSFNVNSYLDEPAGKVSLVDGSLKVGEKVLKPGQAYSGGRIVSTEIEQDIAWKNGYFNFDGADLPTVMRQLERWYDIDVQYQSHVAKRKFRGKLPRNLSLQEILEILRQVNIKYQIQHKTLYIE